MNEQLRRIADALERLAPLPESAENLQGAGAYLWDARTSRLRALEQIAHVPLSLLKGIDQVRDILLANTRQFAQGFPANNALLWGARGMGKSSLVKAVHAKVSDEHPQALALVEIHREDITALPALIAQLKPVKRRFILFCDDLSFDGAEASYKSLKTALEGGLEGKPENVLFYATSNRRHLMPREMMENERQTAIHPAEATEEKVSLSDRFGLWLGFHPCPQEIYLQMVRAYAETFKLSANPRELEAQALEWSVTRGARSGRVAWQFIQDLAGRTGKKL